MHGTPSRSGGDSGERNGDADRPGDEQSVQHTTQATVRIQYGHSVTAKSTRVLLACPDIDWSAQISTGCCGASLDASASVAIIRAVAAKATRCVCYRLRRRDEERRCHVDYRHRCGPDPGVSVAALSHLDA